MITDEMKDAGPGTASSVDRWTWEQIEIYNDKMVGVVTAYSENVGLPGYTMLGSFPIHFTTLTGETIDFTKIRRFLSIKAIDDYHFELRTESENAGMLVVQTINGLIGDPQLPSTWLKISDCKNYDHSNPKGIPVN